MAELGFSNYPVAIDPEGILLIEQDNQTMQIDASKLGGGGEVWEDITNLFTISTISNTSQTATYTGTTITINDLIRVTVNTYDTNSSKINGEIQTNPIRCAEKDASVYCPTNSIQTYDEFGTGVVTYGGRISIRFLSTSDILTISYAYNATIEEKPAILKIERLVENE